MYRASVNIFAGPEQSTFCSRIRAKSVRNVTKPAAEEMLNGSTQRIYRLLTGVHLFNIMNVQMAAYYAFEESGPVSQGT